MSISSIPISSNNSAEAQKIDRGRNTITGNSRRVLLVEDDADIATLLCAHLRSAGASVEWVDNGAVALERALHEEWDLMILDLGLPGLDGIDITRKLALAKPFLCLIIVTARSSETERIMGLEAGGDDYIVKPFSMRELMARVNVVFRRIDNRKSRTQPTLAVVGDLELDAQHHCVRVSGRHVDLTAREFGLLSEFVSHPGRVFRRSELLERVWGSRYEGYRHTVNTHINRLRAKIEVTPSSPRYIQTVWGVGYRLGD